jgi:6-phosphogluconate dehydrogenase
VVRVGQHRQVVGLAVMGSRAGGSAAAGGQPAGAGRDAGAPAEAYDLLRHAAGLAPDRIAEVSAGWRRVVATAIGLGIPVPGLAAALAYYDGLRAERLPANLVQAQRDYFGGHTYRRADRDGVFHTMWGEDCAERRE